MSTLPEPSSPAVRPSSRAAKWLVGLAAVTLATVSIAAYLYHQFRMAEIAAEHLRLMVIGPSTLHPGVAAQFDVSTSEVSGAPVSVPVEVDLYSPDGKRLLGRKESTDQQGRLQVTIPADMSLPAGAALKVAALHRGSREETSAPLAVDHTLLVTQLSLDKPLYQPGETIFYRSLSLSRFGLAVDREISIHFEILDPGGVVVPNSQTDGVTDHGVGNGSFAVPDNLPGGQYALLARGLDGSFPEEKQKFLIRRYRLPRLKKELEFLRDNYAPGDTVTADFSAKRPEGGAAAAAKLRVLATVDGQTVLEKNVQTDNAGTMRVEFKLPEKIARGDGQLAVTIDDGGTRETIAKAIPINLGKLDVRFYPEGGDLVAGLENRVYFVCRNPLGKPIHISGVIESDNARVVAAVETVYEGMGQFSFTPQSGESYRLKIITPIDIKNEAKLPAAAADCPIVLTTGTGVFGPSEPLEFNIRSSKADLPLVVGAWCRGVLVAQVAVVTKKNENGMNPVVLPLPDDVGGIIRLTVFDYTINPNQSDPQLPKPLAERLVYRHSDHRLNVRAADLREHYAPGEKVNLSLAVTNEKNEPVAAALGVSVVDDALLALADDHTPGMSTDFLLASEIENPEDLENADFYLSDDIISTAVRPAVALDLLLGVQGWRRFTEKTRQQLAEEGPEKDRFTRLAAISGPSGPPTMYDNLGRIRANYQKSLAAYYADRTQILYTVITISFLAALGLLLLAFMLGLLRIIRGASFWLPVLSTIGCCAIIGALLTDPQRFAGENVQAVPFLPYHAPEMESAAKNDGKAQNKSAEEKSAEEKTTYKLGAPQPNRRSEGVSPLPGQASQYEQVIARPNRPHGEKTISGPIAPAKTEHFIVRQYTHRHVAGQTGGQGDFAEALFWNPLLIADGDGKVPLSFDLPDSITTFRLRADAHGAARIGSGRVEISSQTPLNTEAK